MMAHLTNSPGHDTIASSYASTSTAASPNTSCKIRYDIFINHRGPDVKKSFASHLYRRLRLHGFQVFLDQPEMETGDRFDSQIEEVIATASVHVAIFSPRYAESKWCLEELVLMFKSGSPIIPVFYNVNPSELRWTSCKDGVYGRFLRILGWTGKNGVYAEALRIHEKKRRYDSKIVEGWREALSKVSYKSGLLLKDCNGDEGELLDRVIQRVEKKVKKTELYTAAYPTGLDGKLKEFTETLLLEQQQHSRETKVVGIVGSGGVGKTTLAMEFFNSKRSDYSKSCFLEDVRETSLIDLQIKLIKDLTSRDLKISSISDGKKKLSDCLAGSQALMILDDVDDDKQLDALFSPAVKKDVLSSDSLILVTSRNKNVLSRIRESPIYELTGLCSEHSERLFCLHAFHQRQAVVGFEELVTKFLDVCAGLPLYLKVVGALLFGKDLKDWKAELRKISKTPPRDVQSKLKISYDSLDDMEKEIFLDIACFFIKEDKDVAIRVWDSSHWEGRLNLQNLVNKCLVEIDSKNCITMHDHLRDMGRGLAQKEPRLRLWCPTENLSADAFQQSTMTTPVRGINMVQQSSGRSSENPVDLGTCFERMNGLQLLRAEGDCLGSISNLLRQSNLLWLRWDSYPDCSLPSLIPMKNLRVLQIAGDKLETLWLSENEAPVQLRELYIDAAHFQLPKSIAQLKHLKKIELRHTIETLPEELFHLCSLKHLRLSTRMMELPNSLANLTKLRNIDLSGCTDLQTLPSFRNLTGLQHINLNDCKMLQMLPDSFGNLIQLKNLSLAGCRNLTISSETLGDIRTLESLDLSLCEKLEEFPSQVTLQRSLKILKLQCPLLETLPPSLGNLWGLKELTLHFCQKLTHLPDSVGELKELRTLMVHHARISCLPVGVTELNKLEILSVRYCPLIEMPFPTALADPKGRRVPDSSVDDCKGLLRLKDLDLHGTRIKELSFTRGFCPNLQRLNISHCLELLEVGALPTRLVSLRLQHSCSLKKIEGLSGLGELRLLDISECKEIEELPGVETLRSLDELRASDCKRLKQTVRKLARATIDRNKKRKS